MSDGEVEESLLGESPGSYGRSEIISSVGMSGGEVAGKLEGSPPGGSSDEILGEEVV